jgi:uncharacterized protein YdeI (YjbR/CyaY-like superfamily)
LAQKAGVDLQTVEPRSRAEWRSWLDAHPDERGGVWLVLHKGDDLPLTYEEAIEEALAFGWIDSKPGKLDDRRYRLWFAPRKAGSAWSRANKERVARMLERGEMSARGLAVLDAARADGSWAALDKVQALVVPDDLAAALDAQPPARANFEAFPPSSKRIILEWIMQAKTPQTRQKRIDETAELAAKNVRAHHWRQPGG